MGNPLHRGGNAGRTAFLRKSDSPREEEAEEEEAGGRFVIQLLGERGDSWVDSEKTLPPNSWALIAAARGCIRRE